MTTSTILRRFWRQLCCLWLLLAFAGLNATQVMAQSKDTCKTDTLLLNTGWNHLTNGLDPVGGYSGFWRVVADPSPNTSEPRPAITISTYPAWAGPIPNTRWMSSYPSAVNDTNGTYRFAACFCIGRNPGTVKFVGDLLADDRARVYVNGVQIGATPLSWAFIGAPTHMDVDISQHVKPGKNCIEVEVDNTNNVAMGFDMAAYVTASNGLSFDKPHCCDPLGSIIGMKFWDKDCDGKQDAGEPGLSGWTIKVTDGSNTYTTTTDVYGNYYFTSLPPGTYTVSEVQQIGWAQSYPTGAGTYTVALSAGQVISSRDFGNCRKPVEEGCFQTQRDSIWCEIGPDGVTVYKYRFDIRSLLSCNGQQTASVGVLSPAGVSVSPSSFSVSNAWGTQGLTIYGPGAVAGATVKLVVRICCFVQGAPEYCCTDTIEVKLPDCKPVNQGCFQIVEDTVYCKEGPNGQQYYGWCFKVKNLSNCVATYFHIIPPAGVTLTPSTLIIGPLAPGATSATYCVQISGPGAVPGPLTFDVRMCDRPKLCCCSDRITIKLPDCPKRDCCDGFFKAFYKLWNSASKTGAASVGGYLAAAGSGSAPIIKVSATLANVSINGLPAYGYFVNGTIFNPFGTTTGVPAPYGHELNWPTIPSGVSMGTPQQFRLNLRFPPMAPGLWKDVVRYCIRFRYTDINCVTCDTLICFSRTRYKFIIWHDAVGLKNQEKGNSLQSAAPGATITGSLLTGDSAALQVLFPSFPSELGEGRYVGMSIMPDGVPLEDVSSSNPAVFFLVADGVATSEFTFQPGDELQLGLRYSDLGSRNALPHTVRLRYVLDSDPLDTLEEEVELTLRKEGLQGGDVLSAGTSDLRNVKTYALHLSNANGSQERIDRVVIRTRDGAKIIAVGPTADDSTAVLGFRQGGTRRAAVEMNGQQTELAAGESQEPIYLTIAGVEGESTTVGFLTLNAHGEVISEGELTLNTPLSSSVMVGDGDHTVTGGMLLQNYPNPATHSTTINFRLRSNQSSVTLRISDATGRVIFTPIEGESMSAGDHALYLNTSALPSGSYFYTISAGTDVETRSLQIHR